MCAQEELEGKEVVGLTHLRNDVRVWMKRYTRIKIGSKKAIQK